jgi:pimeloyl-ACP methyl ester carboxylesterase
LSTLAPIFAVAFTTHQPHYAFLAGLATALGAGTVLDRVGVGQVTAIGHSTGGYVATTLAEQRPAQVAALALINTGPDPDAYIDQGLLGRLLLAPLPGRLLWRLRTEATIRKALTSAFTRPIDIPDTIIQDTLGMTHRALAATGRAGDNHLKQRALPDRLTALGLPVLVIFGADDHRWRSSSAAAYRAVPAAYRAVPGARVELPPGVGHTPMQEDPQTTSTLLLDFAAAAGHPT